MNNKKDEKKNYSSGVDVSVSSTVKVGGGGS
jgi:hypothetical protein